MIKKEDKKKKHTTPLWIFTHKWDKNYFFFLGLSYKYQTYLIFFFFFFKCLCLIIKPRIRIFLNSFVVFAASQALSYVFMYEITVHVAETKRKIVNKLALSTNIIISIKAKHFFFVNKIYGENSPINCNNIIKRNKWMSWHQILFYNLYDLNVNEKQKQWRRQQDKIRKK